MQVKVSIVYFYLLVLLLYELNIVIIFYGPVILLHADGRSQVWDHFRHLSIDRLTNVTQVMHNDILIKSNINAVPDWCL